MADGSGGRGATEISKKKHKNDKIAPEKGETERPHYSGAAGRVVVDGNLIIRLRHLNLHCRAMCARDFAEMKRDSKTTRRRDRRIVATANQLRNLKKHN
ncbi:hypothetical protein Ancab_034285 [Ancistrocladus abbreviatus]